MNRYLIVGFAPIFFTILLCAPKTKISNNNPVKNNPAITNTSDTIQSIDSSCAPLPPVPVSDWKGLNFLVLEKQSIFCQTGYELYSFSNPELGLTPADLSALKPENRIPCDEIKGHMLTVTGVYENGEEYLVSFSDVATGKTITGKTHKHSIKEIVPETDLNWAKKRWINRVVFSRKGTISTLPKENHSFGSIKVKIQDSLLVQDVIAGFTPLPVNPIWLVVKTPQGQLGIIAIRSSWTNTMSDIIREDDPWKSDIMESDPRKVYSWDESMWEIINNHRIVLEMSRDQVLLSWGEPVRREVTDNEGVKQECWFYAAQVLCFNEHQLISINNVQ